MVRKCVGGCTGYVFQACAVKSRVGCIDGYSWGNTVMYYNTYMYCTIYVWGKQMYARIT